MHADNLVAAKALLKENGIPIEDLFQHSKRLVVIKYIRKLGLDPGMRSRALSHDIKSAVDLLSGDPSTKADVHSGRSSAASKRPRTEEGGEGGSHISGSSAMVEVGGEHQPHHHHTPPSQSSSFLNETPSASNETLNENNNADSMSRWAEGMWSGYNVDEMSQWREGDLLAETIVRHGEGTVHQQAMLCAAKYLLHLRRRRSSCNGGGIAEEGDGSSSSSDVDTSLEKEVQRFMNL